MAFVIFNRLLKYAEGALFLSIGFYGVIAVAFEILTLRRSGDVFNLKALKDRVFGKIWGVIGPIVKKKEEDSPLPRLEKEAYGTVIEVGPAGGNQLSRYDKSKVHRIYGVEPNAELHAQLLQAAKEAGLADIFTLVPCGVQDFQTLKKYGVEEGCADTVMSVSVLCSVPRPEEMTRAMYRLLKPGGMVVVHEHVRSQDPVTLVVQSIYEILWPHLFGNCHLKRPTGQYLLAAGKWAKVDFEPQAPEDAYSCIPKIMGRMYKA